MSVPARTPELTSDLLPALGNDVIEVRGGRIIISVILIMREWINCSRPIDYIQFHDFDGRFGAESGRKRTKALGSHWAPFWFLHSDSDEASAWMGRGQLNPTTDAIWPKLSSLRRNNRFCSKVEGSGLARSAERKKYIIRKSPLPVVLLSELSQRNGIWLWGETLHLPNFRFEQMCGKCGSS